MLGFDKDGSSQGFLKVTAQWMGQLTSQYRFCDETFIERVLRDVCVRADYPGHRSVFIVR